MFTDHTFSESINVSFQEFGQVLPILILFLDRFPDVVALNSRYLWIKLDCI